MRSRSSRRATARRSIIGAAAVVALAAAGALAVSPAGAQRPPKPETAAAASAQQLTAAAGAGAHVASRPDGGPVTFVGVPHGRAIAVSGGGNDPETSADAFVAQYGAAFGEPSPGRDLRQDDTSPMAAGGESVGYQQLEGGVPVFAGELRVQVSADGKVRSAAGEMSTGDAVDTAPDVSAAAASDTATNAVAGDAGVDAGDLIASEPELWVYDPTLIGEPSGPRQLVWRLEVSSEAAALRKLVLVDAHSGDVALQIEQIQQALNRQVCDNQNVANANYSCPAAGVVRSEGQGPTGNSEVDKAYDLSGNTYTYYFNSFGRNSIDNAGMTLRSTVRACPAGYGCPMQNAFWDGTQMVYGDTFAGADDVVAHELTHGVTEHESGLVYANQSGAINESLSDVFGEFVDLTFDTSFDNDTAAARWDMGEDLPASIGVIRDMDNPPRFNDPDRMGSPLYYTGTADSGGVHTNSGVNNKAASFMVDGGTFNGQTISGGLGITKVGRIYYEAQVNLLTSGSDYNALGNALNQACTNTIGVDGITAADCVKVGQVVTATEMIVPAPANDNFADAQTISGTTGTVTGSTLGATRQTGEPNHGGGAGSLAGTASIWYKFTAAASGTATITTCNSGFDTLLGVYTGSAVNALTIVGQNDDNGVSACSSSLHSRVQFQAVQGTTYRIAVDGYGTARGATALNWTIPAAPAPTGISGTVTQTGGASPVPGAFVAVLKTSDFSIASGAVADASGNYSVQVPVGTYFLYLVDPAAARVTGFHGAPATVTVTSGVMTDVDPSMAPSQGTIAGTVSQDSPAGTVAGTYALALSSSTGISETGVVANGSGQYSSPNLRAGNHWMVFLDPTGAHASEFFPNSPDAGGASAIGVTGGATASANVSLATQTAVGTGATLSGTITETGTAANLANVFVVALRSSDFRLARATTTNASGQYSLNVEAGSYKLAFIDAAGLHAMEWHNNQPYTGLATATSVTAPAVTNAVLDRRNGSITGTIGDDVSHAALADAWVIAIGPSGVAGGAVTAANGTYTISGLPAGTYRATFVDPVGGHTQEYFNNSPDFAGSTPFTVTGGGTTTVNAELHHP